MTQFIITAVLFFGGILLYIINSLMFKTFKMNHATKVLLFLGSLIPGAGLIIQICYSIWAGSNYQTWGFYSHENVQVRDTWLNRWLFDDVRWNEYDEQKQREAERAREEAEARAAEQAKKAEQERRAKLVQGLAGGTAFIEPIEHVETEEKPEIRTSKKQKVIDID